MKLDITIKAKSSGGKYPMEGLAILMRKAADEIGAYDLADTVLKQHLPVQRRYINDKLGCELLLEIYEDTG